MDILEERLQRAFPPDRWSRHKVCLAVSGGSDSVALVRAMAAIAEKSNVKNNLYIVTVNHQLRGTESDADVFFTEKLGENLGLPVRIKTIERDKLEEEAKKRGSLEDGARKLRYQLLKQAANDIGARYIVTAHHAGDQLETILFRFFRGTGLAGLQGMAPFRPLDESLTIARPMLEMTKTEILEYLCRLKQDYRSDSSNNSHDFARNRIRLELIPLLNDLLPNDWTRSVLRLAKQCEGVNAFLNEHVDRFEVTIQHKLEQDSKYETILRKMKVFRPSKILNRPSKDAVEIPIAPLKNANVEIIRLYLRRLWSRHGWSLGRMGYDEWDRLARAIKEQRATDQLPGNIALSFPLEGIARFEKIEPVK